MANPVRRSYCIWTAVLVLLLVSNGCEAGNGNVAGAPRPPAAGSRESAADRAAERVERAATCETADTPASVVALFFEAYNLRDLKRLMGVFQPVEIFDPSGVPHVGQLRTEDARMWAEAGWAVDDRYELLALSPYPGVGAEITAKRSNRVLKEHGFLSGVVADYKIQMRGCRIIRFVGDRVTGAGGDPCQFYEAFGTLLRAAGGEAWWECQDAPR